MCLVWLKCALYEAREEHLLNIFIVKFKTFFHTFSSSGILNFFKVYFVILFIQVKLKSQTNHQTQYQLLLTQSCCFGYNVSPTKL